MDEPRYWCLCNKCLIRNQGRPPNKIPLLSQQTCYNHSTLNKGRSTFADATAGIHWVQGPGASTYPDVSVPDSEIKSRFLQWLVNHVGSLNFGNDQGDRTRRDRNRDNHSGDRSVRDDVTSCDHATDNPDIAEDEVPEALQDELTPEELEEILQNLPGNDGGVSTPSLNRASYKKLDTIPSWEGLTEGQRAFYIEQLKKLWLNILLIKARRPG